MAEIVTAHLIARNGALAVEVSSAGCAARNGDPADPRALAVLEARGYRPPHEHRSRQITPTDLRLVDLAIVMERRHAAHLSRMKAASESAALIRLLDETGDILDPFSETLTDYERALDVIERRCRSLVEELGAPGGLRESNTRIL